MGNEIHTPHDRFFRKMMQSKEIAQEFFNIHLPADIRNEIDLNSIELRSDTFIETNLRSKITDLLYSVLFKKSGKEGYIYILVEHQSTATKLMPFRMLKYMVAAMERHMAMYEEDVLPIILPIVVYTGCYPYKHSTDIFDLFGDDNKKLATEMLLKPI